MLTREELEESDEEELDESVVASDDREDELEDAESNVSMEELVELNKPLLILISTSVEET
jgi:hypothetical protein